MTEQTFAAGPTAAYQAFLEAGEFRLQRSRSSGRFVFEPRVVEPCTGADDLEWTPTRGRGVVYATTVVRPRGGAAPYNVVLVDLEEGVRMMGVVTNLPPEAVRIGQAVQARIAAREGGARIEFEAVEPAPQA